MASASNLYSGIYQDMNTMGKVVLYPLFLLVFPIVWFIYKCMKD